ncbi:hypothetical protein N9I80_01400 [Aquiluna sp.]|nr:hypothetical protein [Aquiluna sp.]MDA8901983.1 hypothetical protein [Aquiluna sp.]
MRELEDHFNLGHLTASLVLGQDGNYVDVNGTSKLLGGPADLELLKYFRSRSSWVLTTGATARAERYRIPSKAKLAVLSRQAEKALPETLDASEVTVLGSDFPMSIASAISHLENLNPGGIHLEFGPQTLLTAHAEIDRLQIILSSEHETGASNFAEANNLVLGKSQVVDQLFISQVTGRA